jgi:hypothetical protein
MATSCHLPMTLRQCTVVEVGSFRDKINCPQSVDCGLSLSVSLSDGRGTAIGVRSGLSEGVDDGRRLPALQAGHP